MLATVRNREFANAAFVAVLWAAICVAISAAGHDALLLPVLLSLLVYAAVEAFRFSRGTPLRGSATLRLATLTLWTGIGYATLVVGQWYWLPISLIFLGIVLFENEWSRPSSGESAAWMRSSRASVASNRNTDAPSCQSTL